MPSVVSNIRRGKNQSTMVENGQNGKLDKLSERQDTALWSDSDSLVVAMDACDLPNIVIGVLLFGPK